MSVYKKLRKEALTLAAEWLKTLLPDGERELVTPKSVISFEANQESYVWHGTTMLCAPYSSRWFYKRLKAAYKKGIKPDFTVLPYALG